MWLLSKCYFTKSNLKKKKKIVNYFNFLKGHYFTIHITPEESCSYVSFETDAPTTDYPELIQKVLDIFKPGQFVLTFFANDVCRFFHILIDFF